MRYRLALLFIVLTLSGCGGQSVGQLMTVQPADCRQPAVFKGTSIYAKQLDWQGEKLLVTFEAKNISSAPTLLMVTPELVDAQGIRYGTAGASNSMPMAIPSINPGSTGNASISFQVPRGDYTLEFTDITFGRPTVMTTGAFRCTVPALAATPAPSTPCPPQGSVVPFSKVTNPGLAGNYQGCNITTTAKFVGSGAAGYGLPGLENEYVIIRVVAPGEQAPSGLQAPIFVALPLQGSDLAFALKPGEAIILTGGPFDYPALHKGSVFKANSIARAK
ncbi:MAG: DUF4352 domain-containing protein [Thermoplasmata archaeon]